MDIEGLHARNSAKISILCTKSSAQVKIHFRGKTANGKNILDLMDLGASYRDELTLEVDGPGEEDVIQALERALNGSPCTDSRK